MHKFSVSVEIHPLLLSHTPESPLCGEVVLEGPLVFLILHKVHYDSGKPCLVPLCRRGPLVGLSYDGLIRILVGLELGGALAVAIVVMGEGTEMIVR